MIGLPLLSQDAINRAVSTVPGATPDQIWWPLYDYLPYPTTGQNQLAFFTQPIGQGATSAFGAAGTKTEADTNLTSSGLLPKGNRFYWVGVEIKFWAGANAARTIAAEATVGENFNDVNNVLRSGWLRVNIQNRTFLQDGPLDLFPPSTRLTGVQAFADNFTIGASSLVTAADYAAGAGRLYQVVPQWLDAMQGLTCVIFWPNLVTVTTAARIGVRLLGYLVRDPQ